MSDDANIGTSAGGAMPTGTVPAGASGVPASSGGSGIPASGTGAGGVAGQGTVDAANRLSKTVVNTGDPNIQVVSHIRSTSK